MRAVLVANPKATGTTARMRDVLATALAADLKVEIAMTERRGHAIEIARRACDDGVDYVVALGGDGTINEVVNGMLADGPRPGLPVLGVVPAGLTNVLARCLGLPTDPVEATSVLLTGMREGRSRLIGLGKADDRYFTFCAGVGLDAATVRRVEAHRAVTDRVSPWQYARAGTTEYLFHSSHRKPRLRLRSGDADEVAVMLALICNTSPWTYLGDRPLDPCPQAGFQTDLDLFALTRMYALPTLHTLGQLFRGGPQGKRVIQRHDQPEITITADIPTPLQVDGDYVGEIEAVTFRSVPHALRVVVGAGRDKP